MTDPKPLRVGERVRAVGINSRVRFEGVILEQTGHRPPIYAVSCPIVGRRHAFKWDIERLPDDAATRGGENIKENK